MISQGIIIGLPIAAFFVLVTAVCSRLCFRAASTMDDGPYSDRGLVRGFGYGLAAASVVIVLIATAATYPWSAQYHRWDTTTGTVDSVSSRLLGSSKSMTQRFVVRFTDGRERACDDTRCSLLKPGDHLTLSCKREWQYAGEDGWSCNYVRRGGAA